MLNKKPLFITFEGIEGSGKSYLSNKLFKEIKKRKIPVIHTREPGGTIGAEAIRKIILKDYFNSGNNNKNFNKYTDTLLYLAARNEHVINKIKPALLKKKIIICDRFVDSTIAYQVYGKGVSKNLIDSVHKYILGTLKPDLTFVLKVNISKATERLKKRKKRNRYDKFSKSFYIKAQNAFIKIANRNKKRYSVFDNSNDTKEIEILILNKVLNFLNK
jgi:dTMP kinase